MMMTAAAVRESGRGDGSGARGRFGSGGGITIIRGEFFMIMVVVVIVVVAGVMAAAACWLKRR